MSSNQKLLDKAHLLYQPECKNLLDRINKLEVHESDVWIYTYPKAGTTWMQETVWLLLNNCDFIGAKEEIYKRSPFLEYACSKHYLIYLFVLNLLIIFLQDGASKLSSNKK